MTETCELVRFLVGYNIAGFFASMAILLTIESLVEGCHADHPATFFFSAFVIIHTGINIVLFGAIVTAQ